MEQHKTAGTKGIQAVKGLTRSKRVEIEAVRLRARMQSWCSHQARLERSRLLCEHAIDEALARAAAALGDGGSSVAGVVRGRRAGLERQEDLALAVEGSSSLLRAAVDVFCRANCPDRWVELKRKRGGNGSSKGWWEGKAETSAVHDMLQRDLGAEHQRLAQLNAAGLSGGADELSGLVIEVAFPGLAAKICGRLTQSGITGGTEVASTVRR